MNLPQSISCPLRIARPKLAIFSSKKRAHVCEIGPGNSYSILAERAPSQMAVSVVRYRFSGLIWVRARTSTAKNGCATADAGGWSNAGMALRCDCWSADTDCYRCVCCGLDWACAGGGGEGAGLGAAVLENGSDDCGAGVGEAAD